MEEGALVTAVAVLRHAGALAVDHDLVRVVRVQPFDDRGGRRLAHRGAFLSEVSEAEGYGAA